MQVDRVNIVQSLQPITTSDDQQLVHVQRTAELKPPRRHVLQHVPLVLARIVALDVDAAFVLIHPADGQQLPDRRFPWN